MKTETIKGFKDYSGEDAQKRAEIKRILTETFEKYGFEPSETPTVEYEEFVREENSQDEAISDIFKLKDRGKRKLALRYEFTFQLKRLMQRGSQLSELYIEKGEFVSRNGCNSNLDLLGLKNRMDGFEASTGIFYVQGVLSLDSNVENLQERNEIADCKLW